jgi:hypothetical protein
MRTVLSKFSKVNLMLLLSNVAFENEHQSHMLEDGTLTFPAMILWMSQPAVVGVPLLLLLTVI